MSEPISCRIRWRGQITGPFPLATILRRLDDNELSLWHEIEDHDTWRTLEEFLSRMDNDRLVDPGPESPQPRIVEARRPTPADDPSPRRDLPAAAASESARLPAAAQARPKRVRVFVTAGLLLGFLGAHNFYAGYRGTAVAQLLLTGVFYSLGFGLILTWIWALIELLVVHADHRGTPMV